MTYLEILEVLESAARTAEPNATYFRGRVNDASLTSVAANTNLIYTLDTMRGAPDTDNRLELWSITVAFVRQDSTSSESMEANQTQANEESRESIFSQTLIIARAFYSAIYNEDGIMLSGQPAYNQTTRELMGTFTGWALTFQVWLDVGCDDVEIADAIYQNSDESFEVSIRRAEVYTAPDITVTDSDGSTYTHPANKNVTCTPSASPATAVLKNTDGDTISTTSIDPGTTEDITAPDATVVLKNTDGDVIDTEAIPSNVSEDIVIPNVSWTDSDGSSESTPYGDAIVCTEQEKDVTIAFPFASGSDTSGLFTNPSGLTFTLTALAQDGSSGTITVSVNGGSYAAFSNPTSLPNGQTLQVKRTSTGSAGSVTITGTHA